MRKIFRLAILLSAMLLVAVSCIKEPEVSVTEIEQRSLKAWIESNHPELVNNYQEEGGYYVEIMERGDENAEPVSGKDVWLWYEFTGRSLQGKICETRDCMIAEQVGTFTKYTHYVPAFRFSGEESTTMMEGTYLATFNTLKIWDDDEQQIIDFQPRYGTKMRLYLPSSIISKSQSIDGGYEGSYELDESKPMIVDMCIYGHVTNPVAYEGEWVDRFAEVNGGLCDEHKAVIEDTDATEETKARRRTTRTDGESEEADARVLEFYDGRWHQPIDTIEHLYVNYAYNPSKVYGSMGGFDFQVLGQDTLKYPSEDNYLKGGVYKSADLNQRVNAALIERFGEGLNTDEKVLAADSLKRKGAAAKVWYVGRFLDGFIFDTNIDEVKEIIYGEVKSKGSALTFAMGDPESNDYVLSWIYSIPTLRNGQWAAVLSVSTYGYGISGIVGSHLSTTTTDNTAYYDYLNYMNYMNTMNNIYGYGYGGMYNNSYYGYNPYYYGYGYTSSGSTSTTVTTTSTEIPAYSPLLFQIFVE